MLPKTIDVEIVCFACKSKIWLRSRKSKKACWDQNWSWHDVLVLAYFGHKSWRDCWAVKSLQVSTDLSWSRSRVRTLSKRWEFRSRLKFQSKLPFHKTFPWYREPANPELEFEPGLFPWVDPVQSSFFRILLLDPVQAGFYRIQSTTDRLECWRRLSSWIPIRLNWIRNFVLKKKISIPFPKCFNFIYGTWLILEYPNQTQKSRNLFSEQKKKKSNILYKFVIFYSNIFTWKFLLWSLDGKLCVPRNRTEIKRLTNKVPKKYKHKKDFKMQSRK